VGVWRHEVRKCEIKSPEADMLKIGLAKIGGAQIEIHILGGA